MHNFDARSLFDDSGEAAVSVPLPVPPGVHGVAPVLALNYSSAGGDQGEGSGWSIAVGFPDAVRRNARFGVPNYGDPDTFTFNGQDLVPTGNGRYRTQIDSFQRIDRSGEIWTVTEKNGVQLDYGVATDERSAVPQGIFAWHLSRVTDTFGNRIEFIYEGPTDARRLQKIRYTVNGGSAVGQEQSVALYWQSRPDPRRSSVYGSEIVLEADTNLHLRSLRQPPRHI